jgi:hypothetical protein
MIVIEGAGIKLNETPLHEDMEEWWWYGSTHS